MDEFVQPGDDTIKLYLRPASEAHLHLHAVEGIGGAYVHLGQSFNFTGINRKQETYILIGVEHY